MSDTRGAIALAIGEMAKAGVSTEEIRKALATNLVLICRASEAGEMAAVRDVKVASGFWDEATGKRG